MPAAGTRVVVPLGKRRLTGVVIGVAEPPPGDVELREFEAVLDAHPFLPRDVIELAAWVSDYYLAGPGAALAMAMPPNALTNRADAHRTARYVALTAEGHDLAARADDAVLTGRQRDAVELLRGTPDGLPAQVLSSRGISSAVVARLKARALVTIRQVRQERDPFLAAAGSAALSDPVDTADRPLTGEQHDAVTRLQSLAKEQAFRVALLHGVTGSGKTEVYLHLAEAVRRQWPRRADAGAGDCADARGCRGVSRAFRRPCCHPTQRALGRRTPRPVASHPSRRSRHRRRHTVRGVCAARRAWPHHRGRGTRHVVQAGGNAPIPRARRRRDAWKACRCPGRAGLGDTLDGVLLQRDAEAL